MVISAAGGGIVCASMTLALSKVQPALSFSAPLHPDFAGSSRVSSGTSYGTMLARAWRRTGGESRHAFNPCNLPHVNEFGRAAGVLLRLMLPVYAFMTSLTSAALFLHWSCSITLFVLF
jgi:hypothetical protein